MLREKGEVNKMSTNIKDYYEKLENINTTDNVEAFDARMAAIDLEQWFCGLLAAADNEITEKSIAFRIFDQIWYWYCGGTEDGVWQYYEHGIDEELMNEVAAVLKEYGCDEFAEQYLNGANDLMPLMTNFPYEQSDLIDELSQKYDTYIEANALRICTALRNYLIANKAEIYDAFADTIIEDPEEERTDTLPEGLDLTGFFSAFLNSSELSDEHKADIQALMGKLGK